MAENARHICRDSWLGCAYACDWLYGWTRRFRASKVNCLYRCPDVLWSFRIRAYGGRTQDYAHDGVVAASRRYVHRNAHFGSSRRRDPRALRLMAVGIFPIRWRDDSCRHRICRGLLARRTHGRRVAEEKHSRRDEGVFRQPCRAMRRLGLRRAHFRCERLYELGADFHRREVFAGRRNCREGRNVRAQPRSDDYRPYGGFRHGLLRSPLPAFPPRHPDRRASLRCAAFCRVRLCAFCGHVLRGACRMGDCARALPVQHVHFDI